MKKILIYTVIVMSFTSICWAQSEPKAINTKDMIEKFDRSELERGHVEDKIDIMPEFEIPKIEFKASQPKTVSKPKLDNKEKVAAKPTTASKSKVSKAKASKAKVVISNKTIKLMQLNKNDKIVINKGKTYIYRLLKTKIIQYKYNEKLPLDSAGLRASGNNSYYVVNKVQLVKDAKKLNFVAKKSTRPRRARNNRKSTANTKKPVIVVTYVVTADMAVKRKEIEDKFNGGKPIKKNLKLKDLLINDDVYIFGDIQLIARRSKNIAGQRKYWLIEKLDTANSSVKEIATNKYNISKRYQ